MATEKPCDKCGQNARVAQSILDDALLIKIGRALGLSRAAAPYLILDCPQCGERIVPVPMDGNEDREL
jgi:hypothetical protein